jgi:hypothetical protein
LRRASSVAYSGRVASRSAGKTSHAQESSNDGIASRDCRIACRVARYFAKSQARSEKSRGWHSSESRRITGRVPCSFAQGNTLSEKSGGRSSITIAC